MRSCLSIHLCLLLLLGTVTLAGAGCGELSEGGMLDVAYTPDGRIVAFTLGETRVFDGELTSTLKTMETPWAGAWGSGAAQVAMSNDGQTFALSSGKAVDVYDLASGARRAHIVVNEAREESAPISGIALSGTGDLVAVAVTPIYLGPPRLGVWRVDTGALVVDIKQPTGREYWSWGPGIALSPDGDVLYCLDTNFNATGGEARTWMTAWTVNEGASLWERELAPDPTKDQTMFISGIAYAMALSPDGTMLATAPEVRRWNARTGDALPTSADVPSGSSSISFAPDGINLVTTSATNTFPDPQVIAPDGSLVRNWPVDRNRVCSGAVISPDGQRVAASCSLWLKVWDIATGALVHNRKVSGRVY